MATPPEDLTGTNKFIPDFDLNNPPGIDQSRRFGDDHFRGIKNVLNNCFEFIAGKVTANHTELSYVKGVTSPIQTQLDNISAGTTFTFWVTGQAADGFVYLNTSDPGNDIISNTVRYFAVNVANAAAADRNGMAQFAVSINDGPFGAPSAAFFINSFGAGGLDDGWRSWEAQPTQTKVTFRFWAPSVIPNDTNYFFQFDMRTTKA